jgi:hypothetical protein
VAGLKPGREKDLPMTAKSRTTSLILAATLGGCGGPALHDDAAVAPGAEPLCSGTKCDGGRIGWKLVIDDVLEARDSIELEEDHGAEIKAVCLLSSSLEERLEKGEYRFEFAAEYDDDIGEILMTIYRDDRIFGLVDADKSLVEKSANAAAFKFVASLGAEESCDDVEIEDVSWRIRVYEATGEAEAEDTEGDPDKDADVEADSDTDADADAETDG